MKPAFLAPNLVEHFYVGGPKIGALRGIEVTSPRQPEEWIAATVSRADAPGVGPARTAEGDLLRDLVVKDPRGWLGTETSDGDVGILVKLLDAGERLPVHVHPDRAFAARHLDCPYGKTEAWLVLDATDDAAVYLGWNADVDPDELARARDEQDNAWLLGHLNRIEVRPGDGILVPAGTAHAIGAGVFITEVQEPTDFSILLEWSVTTSTREESHLGLGFDLAMQAVSTKALAADELAALQVHTELSASAATALALLPEAARPFFRLDLAGAGARVPAGFAAVIVLEGSGALRGEGDEVEVQQGAALAVPAGFGDWTVTGDARLVVARPGDPVTRAGAR